MRAGSREQPIPYRLTPAGERVCVMGELAEQVASVPRTRLEMGQSPIGRAVVWFAEPAEGAESPEPMTAGERAQALYILRRIFKKLAQIFALAEPVPRVEWFRASGDTVCGACERTYYDHAQDPREPWMTLLCGGDRVKL